MRSVKFGPEQPNLTHCCNTLLPPDYLNILPPLPCRRVWSCGAIRTNLRTFLPHFNNSHFPHKSRKHRAEGIGVRMAAYKLVLIRHGESCWNQENRFCGWFDADLSDTGEQEARRGGQALKGNRRMSQGPNRALSLSRSLD